MLRVPDVENIQGPMTKIATAATGAGTAVGTAGMPIAIFGLSLSEWAAGLTALFVIFQIIVIFPAVIKRVREIYARVRKWFV